MKNKVYSCSCGCGASIKFSVVDGELFIDFLSCDFYSRQGFGGNVALYLKVLGQTLLGQKNICLKEILLTKEDLINLKKYLTSLELKKIDKNNIQNHSRIKLSYSEDFGFTFKLISLLSIKEILRRKIHWAYEISFGAHERDLLVRKINKILVFEKISATN